MFNVDDISAIKTEAFQSLVHKEAAVLGDAELHEVEQDFVDFINGPGNYEDYANWRQAWRAFIEFCTDTDEDEQDDEATVIGYVHGGTVFDSRILTAENQMALF